MTRYDYELFEEYMRAEAAGSSHDTEHIYRVLASALDIAETEPGADADVLICACLLHDVGRREQFENPALCHAEVGAAKAYAFLVSHGYAEDFAAHVRDCITTHRFRGDNRPESLEAKILFDADKLDVAGAIGIARTLIYNGETARPLYTRLPDGRIALGDDDSSPSFFHEYERKLKKIYSGFYTNRGRELAESRRAAAEAFRDNLLAELGGGLTDEKLGKYLK